jgi:F-type H+-transporting ATPase subunit delta
MKKVPLSVARRYARALLDVTLQQQGKGDVMAAQLSSAAALLDDQPDLGRALLNPAVPADKKKKIAAGVWGGKNKEDALLVRLVDLLIDRGRIAILPAIAAVFQDLWNAHRGVVAAEAVSAVPLASSQKDALAAAARKLAGREVILSASVDARLMGGVVLRMNGRTYDGSVRAQLERLRAQLASGPSSSSPHSSPQS